MAKNKITINHQHGDVEYKMTKEMADFLLTTRKGEDKKKHPQEYLCDVVNSQYGLKDRCVRVLTTL